jgi:hypothetical protein
MDKYQEGYDAFEAGAETPQPNPYTDPFDREEWLTGYKAAERQYEQF